MCSGLVDCYPAPRPPHVVEFKTEQMDRLLGFKIEPAEALRILQALEYKVEPAGANTYKVTVPTHRLDVQEGAADLIEDIVRIYGYDRVPTTLLSEPLPRQQANEPIVFEGIDTVVLSMGNKAEDGLHRSLKSKVADLYPVGDCVTPRKIEEAILDGERAGWMI